MSICIFIKCWNRVLTATREAGRYMVATIVRALRDFESLRVCSVIRIRRSFSSLAVAAIDLIKATSVFSA